MSTSKQSSVSSSSPSSSSCEDKFPSNIPSTSRGNLVSTMVSQPSNSQPHHFSSTTQNISSSMAPGSMNVVSSAQVVGNNSHPSTPSPAPSQNISSSMPNSQTVSPSPVQTLIQAVTPQHINVQPGQQIQASSVSQALSSHSFSNLQQSRIPTPQPQQIVNQQLAVQNNQNIVATMAAAQPGHQIVTANAANSQLAGATAVQPMNIQLQHPQQISIAQPQVSQQTVQMQAAQQSPAPSQVHQIQANQQASQQIVQHPCSFNLAPGQTTLTVSMAPMAQQTSGQATHIAPAQHTVAAHPSVASSPVPHLQAVFQHPMQNSAYYPIYAGGHQGTPFMFPGNLTIQPANMSTFQSLGVNQAGARSLTLPPSNLDPTKQTATIMPVSVSNKAAAVTAAPASVVQAATHVQISGGKATGSQIINATAIQQGTKSVYANQPGQCSYTIPCSTVNGQQAFVIGQLGVLPAGTQHASAILPAKPGDPNQKQKSFVMSGTFQSKSPILPQPVCTTATVLSGTHFKQLSNNQQLISSQTPTTMIASQQQILGSFQTATANFASPGHIAQGINWGSPGCLQSPAMIQPNTQIVIRGSQNAEMFFQSPTAHSTFQAVAQPQLQAHPAVISTSNSSVTPVASVAPSSTTTVTTSSAPTQKLKQAPEQTSNILPKSTSALSTSSTMTTATRNLSILPASSTISVSNLPMAQVRPASAVPSSPNKVCVAQQGKIKVRARVSPGPSGTVRPTLVGVGQRVERQTQTAIQPKPRPLAPSKPTTVAQKLAGVSSASQPKTLSKAILSNSQQIQPNNVNVVTPEPLKDISSKKPDTSTKLDVASVKSDKVPPSAASTPSIMPQLSNGNESEKLVDKKDNSAENKENSVESSSVVDENIVNSNAEIKPSEEPPKEKQLQKAIVKPSILSHFVDGYIIFEGSEPFPVNRSSPLHAGSNNTNNSCNNGEINGNDSEQYSRKRKIPELNNGPALENDDEIEMKKSGDDKLTPEPPLLQDESMPIQTDAGTPESSPLSSLEEMEVEPGYDENSNSPPTLQPAASETYLDCYQKNPVKWTVQEVYEFVRALCCTGIAEEFLSQEIDGQALMLLKEEHLVTTMNIKLGPALKICSRIRTFRTDED
ncbi:Polyhomeotic-like protein 2 [Nymphon striatum]|nr:Polyhomeotic-like protein 2 [Nymphon striatum]